MRTGVAWRIVSASGMAACVLVGATAAAVEGAPIVTGTDSGPAGDVRVFDGAPPAQQANFAPYGTFTGGVRVAAGDVNGDVFIDVITAPGPGAGPHVKVFNGQTLGEVHSFFAYDPSFTGGVYVAAGDVTGDGRADIVTGAGSAVTHVKVFNGGTLAEAHSFFAFPSFSGGVRVAAGDVNGDGRADIIAGTAPGAGHVKVFDGVSGGEINSFFPYDGGFTGGVFVAAGDVNGDGRADLITGTDETSGAAGGHVKVFDGRSGGLLQSFFPFGSFSGGVRVGAGDVNGDGLADIITGAGPGGGGHVKAYDGQSLAELSSFFPYGTFTGGVFVAGGSPVPEPGGVTLAVVAGAVAALRRRRRCPRRIA